MPTSPGPDLEAERQILMSSWVFVSSGNFLKSWVIVPFKSVLVVCAVLTLVVAMLMLVVAMLMLVVAMLRLVVAMLMLVVAMLI